jgi:MYXO-CTERM domain-containing protein
LAGAQCLTGGQCGCTVDADCGGATSGRVCDQAISRCTPGCRGTGGNTCPVSLVCSSTTTAIGHCSDPSSVPPDGGTGGTTGAGGGPADGGGSDARADAADSGSGAGAGGDDGSTDNLGLGRHITGGGCRCDLDGGDGSSWPTLLSLAGLLALFVRPSRRRRSALRG